MNTETVLFTTQQGYANLNQWLETFFVVFVQCKVIVHIFFSKYPKLLERV